MFSEKEIAVAPYSDIRQAYSDLALFKSQNVKITFNAIRRNNGFEALEEWEHLIDGNAATKPVDIYREKRKAIRQDRDPDGWKEDDLNKVFPELGFGSTEERIADYAEIGVVIKS